MVVVGDMAVSPPSPRRRPLPPNAADIPSPPLLDIPKSEMTNKVSTESPSTVFRKSSSTGDSSIAFKMKWEESADTTTEPPRPHFRRGRRPVESLKRTASMKLSDFPRRVLKIFNARTGYCLFESPPRHVQIESCVFEGAFRIDAASKNKILRIDVWAESIPSVRMSPTGTPRRFSKEKGVASQLSSGAKVAAAVRILGEVSPSSSPKKTVSKRTRQKKIRLVGSVTIRADSLDGVRSDEPKSIRIGANKDDCDEFEMYHDKSVVTKDMSAARENSGREIGHMVVDRWKIVRRGGTRTGIAQDEKVPPRRRKTGSGKNLSGIFGSRFLRSPKRRNSPKFTSSPRDQMISSENFYTMEELQKELRNSKTRKEFCKHLSVAQRLITKSVPLEITHLSSANECLGDLKRFPVEVNGTVYRDHIRSATRRAAFVTFCSELEDHVSEALKDETCKKGFFASNCGDGAASPSTKMSMDDSPSFLLGLGHMSSDSATLPMRRRRRQSSFRRRSLRSISYRRRVSETMPSSAPIAAWICQNINENRIGQCVQDAIFKVLAVDYEKSLTFVLYDMSNQKDTKKEISKVTVTKSTVRVEKIIHYELNNHEHDFNLMIHVKTIARLSLVTGEEDIRFEMGFDHDTDKREYELTSHDDVLTLHSPSKSMPKKELLDVYMKCLGISPFPTMKADDSARRRHGSADAGRRSRRAQSGGTAAVPAPSVFRKLHTDAV